MAKKPKKKKTPKYLFYVDALQRRVDRDGINKVQTALGYRSPTTIYNWLRNKQIPITAIEKVKEYCHGGKPLEGGAQ